VPDVVVKLSDKRRAWTYGSVGVGVDYGPKIWKEHHHVFTAHVQQTTYVEPSAALQLGDPKRLQYLRGTWKKKTCWSSKNMPRLEREASGDAIQCLFCMCSLFCYLRDGKDKSWYSTTIQQKRNLAMANTVPTSPSDRFPPPQLAPYLDADPPEMGTCKHCRTCLHPGDLESCPWRNQSNDNARKSGAKALRNLALGVSMRPKKGKDKENEE
jgi:hypothetical protein